MLTLNIEAQTLEGLKTEVENLYNDMFGEVKVSDQPELPMQTTMSVEAGLTGPHTAPSVPPVQDERINLTTPIPELAPQAGLPSMVQDTVQVAHEHIVENPSQPESGQAGPELDSRGMTWDARIHSTSRNKNKDGSWRNRKGVDKLLLAQVEAELLGGTSEPAKVETPSIPSQAPVEAQPVQAPAPVTDDNGTPVHTLDTFKGNIIEILAHLVNSGRIDQNYIQQLKEYFGVAEMYHITSDDVKCGELFESMVKHGLILEGRQ